MKVNYLVNAKTLNGLMVVYDTLISFMESGLLGIRTRPTRINTEILNDNTDYPFLSEYEIDTDLLDDDVTNFHPDAIALPYFNEGKGDSSADSAFDLTITVDNNTYRDSIGRHLCETYAGKPIFIDNDLMINYTSEDNKVFVSFVAETHSNTCIDRKFFIS